MRWQNKPPLNGRELVAEDVKYSFERFLGEKGNANKPMLASVDKVEAPDKYTVRVTLKEPFAWFLDMLSNPGALWIIARECVEKSGGDLRKVESAVVRGPTLWKTTSRTWASPSCGIRPTSPRACPTSIGST